MEVQLHENAKLNLAGNDFTLSKSGLSEADNPLLSVIEDEEDQTTVLTARERRLLLSEEQKKQVNINEYLTPRERKAWEHMPKAKRESIMRRVRRSTDYKKLVTMSHQLKEKRKSLRSENHTEDTPIDRANDKPSSSMQRDRPTEDSGHVSTNAIAGQGEKTAKKSAYKIKSETNFAKTKATRAAHEVREKVAKSEKKKATNNKDGPISDEVPSMVKRISGAIVSVVGVISFGSVILVTSSILVLGFFFLTAWYTTTHVSPTSTEIGHFIDDVERWREDVTECCEELGCPELVNVALAIIQHETRGQTSAENTSIKYDDVMQRFTQTWQYPFFYAVNGRDPTAYDSIYHGVMYLRDCINRAEDEGCDFKTGVAAYNFGSSFISYVKQNGGTYTQELASKFCGKHCNYNRVKYSGIHSPDGKRYSYGNEYFFAELVDIYPYIGVSAELGTVIEAAQWAVDNQVPYIWGGESESGMDCSGLVVWSYRKIGISLPHNAQMQYNTVELIPIEEAVAGDLIFYTNGTRISHVGIYMNYDGTSYFDIEANGDQTHQGGEPYAVHYRRVNMKRYVSAGRVRQ